MGGVSFQCLQLTEATKQLSIHSLPLVLTIHLKRFHRPNSSKPSTSSSSFPSSSSSSSSSASSSSSSSSSSFSSSGAGGSSKLDTYIQFPLTCFDLSPYLHQSLLNPLSPS